jgi:hypothetical protein
MFKMVAYNHKNKKNVDSEDITPQSLLRKLKKRNSNDSPFIDTNSSLCLRKMNYLINNLSSFSLDTYVYSPYKEDLVDVVNERNSTILRLLEENAELMRRICNLDRNHVYRRKKKLELAKQAPVCTIEVIDISNGNNDIVKEGLPQNTSLSKTYPWILPGCDFSIIETEDITPSDQVELAHQLDLEALISNAVDSLDTKMEIESNAHSSQLNICDKLLSGDYECEENYLSSLAYEVNMIGGTTTPIIIDAWLNEAAKEITAPYSTIEIKAIK